MKCKYCNGELEEGARFCRFCGKKVEEAQSIPFPAYVNEKAAEPEPVEVAANIDIDDIDIDNIDDTDIDADIPDIGVDNGDYSIPTQDRGIPVSQDRAPKKKRNVLTVVIILVSILVVLPIIVTASILVGRFMASSGGNNNGPQPGSGNYGETSGNDYIYDSDRWYPDDDYSDTTVPDDGYYNDTEQNYYDDTTAAETEPEPEITTEKDEPETEPETTYDDNKKIVIAHGGLRLRNKPDISTGSIVGLIPNGTIITVEKIERNWAYTCFDGVYGWCSCDFLFKPYVYTGKPIYMATVNAYDGVDLTTENYVASDDFYTIIPDGQTVFVYVIEGTRAFVKFNNIYGWCSTEHLVMTNLP